MYICVHKVGLGGGTGKRCQKHFKEECEQDDGERDMGTGTEHSFNGSDFLTKQVCFLLSNCSTPTVQKSHFHRLKFGKAWFLGIV